MKSTALLSAVICLCFVSQSDALMKKELKLIKLDFPPTKISLSVQIESEADRPPPPKYFKTSIAHGFKVPEGIEKEAAALGYKMSERKTWVGGKTQQMPFDSFKFTWGHVYSWSTPTRGSATYSYICRDQDTFCFKIGAYQKLYWDFKWSTLSFSDSTQKKIIERDIHENR